MNRYSTLAALGTVAVAATTLAACSGGSSTTTTTTMKKATTTTYLLPPQVLTPTTIIHGSSFTVPVQQPSGKAVASYNDTGNQIIITKKGVLPFHLFVDIGTTVTWTNLTGKPVSITNYAKHFSAPSIPPGGTFTWSSDTSTSERYRVSNGFDGRIDVGAFPH